MQQPLWILVGAALLALGAGSIGARLSTRSDAHGDEEALRHVERTLRETRTQVQRLEERVATLERRPEPTPAAPEPKPAAAPSPRPSAAASELAVENDPLRNELRRLIRDGLPAAEFAKYLEGVRKEGTMDAVLRAATKLAEERPDDAKAHYALARIFIEKLQAESNYILKGSWAEKAIAEYDSALSVAPDYWEPRFDKAMTLSFYPEQFGKTPDAIREFEKALELQRGSNADTRFAETYLQLSRLYARDGNREKAEALLLEGQRIFPANEAFRKHLEILRKP